MYFITELMPHATCSEVPSKSSSRSEPLTVIRHSMWVSNSSMPSASIAAHHDPFGSAAIALRIAVSARPRSSAESSARSARPVSSRNCCRPFAQIRCAATWAYRSPMT